MQLAAETAKFFLADTGGLTSEARPGAHRRNTDRREKTCHR
jgi:hypothetical protein